MKSVEGDYGDLRLFWTELFDYWWLMLGNLAGHCELCSVNKILFWSSCVIWTVVLVIRLYGQSIRPFDSFEITSIVYRQSTIRAPRYESGYKLMGGLNWQSWGSWPDPSYNQHWILASMLLWKMAYFSILSRRVWLLKELNQNQWNLSNWTCVFKSIRLPFPEDLQTLCFFLRF